MSSVRPSLYVDRFGAIVAPELDGTESWLDPFWPGDAWPADLKVPEGVAVVILVLRGMPYREYLRTAHWAGVRHRTMIRATLRQCQTGCGKDAVDADHFVYDRRGFERPEDVMALCRECHKAKHRAFMARTREEIRNLQP